MRIIHLAADYKNPITVSRRHELHVQATEQLCFSATLRANEGLFQLIERRSVNQSVD